jgi:hypothetical protein
MSRQILLCVETNSKARTDYQYINETIHRFYVNDPKISYKPIFLESKKDAYWHPFNLSYTSIMIGNIIGFLLVFVYRYSLRFSFILFFK